MEAMGKVIQMGGCTLQPIKAGRVLGAAQREDLENVLVVGERLMDSRFDLLDQLNLILTEMKLENARLQDRIRFLECKSVVVLDRGCGYAGEDKEGKGWQG